MNNSGLICECGFRFSGAGEFRNCQAFITKDGHSGVICPKCGNNYVDGQKIEKENNNGCSNQTI